MEPSRVSFSLKYQEPNTRLMVTHEGLRGDAQTRCDSQGRLVGDSQQSENTAGTRRSAGISVLEGLTLPDPSPNSRLRGEVGCTYRCAPTVTSVDLRFRGNYGGRNMLRPYRVYASLKLCVTGALAGI